MSQSDTKKKTTKKCPKKALAPAPKLEKFLGQSYVLDHSENYEEFLRELEVKTHIRLKAMTSKPIVSLSQVKNQYVLSTSYPEGRHIKIQFRPGKELNRWEGSEHRTSSVFRIIDNKVIEEQNTDGKMVLIEREFKKKELTVTMEVNNVKCFRWYTLLEESKHSIKTETSRRSFLWNPVEITSTHSTKDIKYVTPEESISKEEENVCY